MTDVIEWNLAGEVLQTAADTAAIDLLQENASKEAAAMFASAEEADAREKVESDAVAKEVADTAMRFLAQENASKEAAAMFASAEEADARAKVEADAVAKEAADTAMRVLAESAAKLAKDARVVFNSMQPVNDKVSWDEFLIWFTNFTKEKVAKKRASSSSSTALPELKKSAIRMAVEAQTAPFLNATQMMMQGANSGSTSTAAKLTTAKAKEVPTSTTVTILKAKKTALLKSIVSGLKASLKGKKFYSGYDSRSEDCNAEAVMSFDEFKELFGKVGTTPADAKEKSVIKIKNLTKADIVTVFGTLTDGLSTQTFSKPHNFSKQHKMGSKKIDVRSAHMTFSTSTSNCKIKFNVHTIDNDSGNFFGRDEAGDY